MPDTEKPDMRTIYKLVFYTFVIFLIPSKAFPQHPVKQVEIRLVQYMPDRPFPYKMKDWKYIARKQDSLLFNFKAKGMFLPLIWWDDTKLNFPIRSFGLPSYVGSIPTLDSKTHYEALPVIGSVLGASLAGIDKHNQNGNDFVTMCKQFYNKANGVNLIMDNIDRNSVRQ